MYMEKYLLLAHMTKDLYLDLYLCRLSTTIN